MSTENQSLINENSEELGDEKHCQDGSCCSNIDGGSIASNVDKSVCHFCPVPKKKRTRTISEDYVPKVEIYAHDMIICSACDSQSIIPHTIQVTRLRVANLCCAGEEKIIHSTLEPIKGIEHVAVNVIGRYTIIKHCSVACCAPAHKIVDLLNEKQLGVSIQEVANHEVEEVEGFNKKQALHVLIVCLLFLIGLTFHFVDGLHDASIGIYLTSTSLGAFPIVYASYVTVVLRHTIDIHVLMIIAIIGAVAAHEYFDASLVVSLFISAELIESIVMLHVRRAVRTSSGTASKEAFLANGTKVHADDLKVGDVLAVRVGEMIMGDGIVIKGEGVVDESALTGESEPVRKKHNSTVLSGTVVQNGYMEIKLTADTAGSTMSKLNQAVMDVQADRGEYARMVDQFSMYWTPGVLVAATLFIIIAGGITKQWHLYLYRGLVLLVLACPCAIVIAAPIPSVCAIATAAKHGVLIRGSTVIERMGRVNAVALDKTGTLTKGFFKVNEKLILTAHNNNKRQFNPLQLAAAVEQKSTHPLANAVVAEYCGCIANMTESEIKMPNVKKIKVVDGVGVTGYVEYSNNWHYVCIGNEKLLKQHDGNVVVTESQQKLMDNFIQKSTGMETLLITVDDSLEMMLSLSDEIRREATNFISHLRTMNMSIAMLTGDNESVAHNVCSRIGLTESECYARMLPSDKLAWIQHRQSERKQRKLSFNNSHKSSLSGAGYVELTYDDIQGDLEAPLSGDIESNSNTSDFSVSGNGQVGKEWKAQRVLMVGDGINDSTALTAATVGVAMGAGGSAMAVASADVVLMSDNLLLIPPSIKLCQLARRTVIEGFVIAILVKIVAIILTILGRLDFWQAILIDIGCLIVVVMNGTKPLCTASYFK